MNVLSNTTQTNKVDTVGGGHAHQYPIPTMMFNKKNATGPGGYTLLQGHIKLMAMVPNIPENHVSEKSSRSRLVAPDRHACCSCPSSHLLPPVTPRMMPSTIAPKYEQYYNSYYKNLTIPHAPPFSNGNGYNTQFPCPDMWYPHLAQTSLQSAQFHRPIAMMPSFDTTTVPAVKSSMESPVPYMAPPYMNPQHWLPPQLTYQQMMSSYPLHCQPSYNPHNHPMPFPPYTNEAFPYVTQHQRQSSYPPYAAQSLPNCMNNGAFPSPHTNPCSMPLCQNCCSLPSLPSECNRKCKSSNRLSSKHRKSKRSPATECEDLCVVVEEENLGTSSSSSSSSSSSEEPEIIQEEEHNLPAVNDITPLENFSEEKEIKMTSEPTSIPNQLAGRNKSKEAPVVVAVHDCFASDSSEAEVDADLSTRMDKVSLFKTRKPALKNRRQSGSSAATAEVFEDLENDLNPDETRTYTCDYLCELLASQDWKSCYVALQILVRLARHRPQRLLKYLDENGIILWYTFNHITSPKSTLCRAAIVTFKELFRRIPTALDNHLDKVTEKLVVKSLSPNNFIRIECNNALMAMVEHCNLIKIVGALENIRKKPPTRAAGHKMALARMALQIILTAGVDNCLMSQPYAEKLLPMMFCFMMEPDSGIRTVAKQALGMLMNHLQFETAVMRYVTFDRNSTEVFKKLDKMRGRNAKNRGAQRKSSMLLTETK